MLARNVLGTRRVPQSRIGRRLGILGTMAIAAWALFGGTALVGATHVDPVEVGGNPDCSELVEGESGEARLDASDFGADGTYDEGDFEMTPGDAEFSVTIDFHGDPVTSFDFENADPDVVAVFVKGGNTGNLYEYDPPTDADEGLVAPLGPQGQATEISHISFCFLTEQPTPSPSPSPTPSPTATGTEVSATGTPTLPPTPSPSPSPSPSPTQLGATATPTQALATATPTEAGVTPPSTSTGDASRPSGSSPIALVLLLLVAGTAGVLVLSPAPRRGRH
jgi:hypothetical protein